MNLLLLKSTRLVMFILISYIYYFTFDDHTTIQMTFIVVAAIGFCLNHFLLSTSFGDTYYPFIIILDSILTVGFAFFFPESTLYLILFGVNAITLFIGEDNKKVILGFVLGFLGAYGICIYYTYQVLGSIDVMSHIVNFSFIIFSAIVGQLIHKLEHAQEKNKYQYDELHQTHQALKDAHQQLHTYSEQVEELTLTRERNRIAGEIHDTVGHKMTALLVQLQVAKELLEIQPEKSKQTVLLCEDLARNALQELRLSVRTLKETDEQHSFMTTTRKILEEYQEMTGLESTFQIKGAVTQIPIPIQLDLTRIIQESITNAVRHGQASTCHIEIVIDEPSIALTIHDNGYGTSEVSAGFGLKNMRERVLEHGGNIMFESTPAQGFIVKASFPIKDIQWQIGGVT